MYVIEYEVIKSKYQCQERCHNFGGCSFLWVVVKCSISKLLKLVKIPSAFGIFAYQHVYSML